jgi:hypothetical protein
VEGSIVRSFHELFQEALPQYMAIGMSQAEFWEGPLWLAGAYREAAAIRDKQADAEAWRMGAYVYQAVLRASPVLHAFASKGAKPAEWLEEPFTVSAERQAEEEAERTQRRMEAGKAVVETFALMFNARRQAAEPSADE